ncbi:MAG: hypothetical protein DME12_09800 [Candidatus Rokuibacteriota bacterium]|nr:MAG: hypothetical protein DME12_09800 [Candidatus Rokubacteria bacterium]
MVTQMAPGCVQSVTPGGRAFGWSAFGGCVYVETVTHPCRAKTLAPKGSAHLQRVTTEPVCELTGLDADTKYIPATPTARAGVSESAGVPLSGSLPTTTNLAVAFPPTYMSVAVNA